jgi:uncharacterized heparinase superfamily protein
MSDESKADTPLFAPKPARARKVKPSRDVYESGPQQLARGSVAGPSISERIAAAFGSLVSKTGLSRLPMGGSYPLKLIVAPPDLWRGDASKGAAIAKGQLACPGLMLDTTTQRYVDVTGSADQLAWLHGFSWLRDLAAAHDGTAGASYSERLIKLWLQDVTRTPPVAWRPDVVGLRLINWISHAPMLLSSTDQVYRSAVLTALARATKQLHRTVEKAADGPQLLTAAAGLIMAGLTLPGREAAETKGAAVLETALDRLIGLDGGFATRSPEDMLGVLKVLLTIRAAYQTRGQAYPGGLLRAIDRLVPALKGLVMGDGMLGQFHGGGATRQADFDDTLAVAAVNAKPLKNAAHSGYQRLEGGRAILVMDAGPPPSGKLSANAHAGVLAFEFSDGPQRLIINCGSEGTRPSVVPNTLLAAMRSTAAHSTLVLNNANATEMRSDGFLGNGVDEVTATRQENEDGSWIEAVHDGYAARFGFDHRRRLFLKTDGMDMRGEDRLQVTKPGKAKAGLPVDVRFHLAPGVVAITTQGGSGAALKMPGGAAWMFRARGGTIAVTESVSISAEGPRKTTQLVLSTLTAADGVVLNWSLQRQAK